MACGFAQSTLREIFQTMQTCKLGYKSGIIKSYVPMESNYRYPVEIRPAASEAFRKTHWANLPMKCTRTTPLGRFFPSMRH